jgi:peroxiredoxin
MTGTGIGLLAARGLLAGTFVVAGTAKLVNRDGSIQALSAFGAPRFTRRLIPFLPFAEIAVAVALLFAASSWYAACASVALLVTFIAGISVNLARGRRLPCNCFGQLQAAPISGWTLARNGALAICAAWLVLAGPAPPSTDLWVWFSGLDGHWKQVALAAAAVLGVGLRLLVRTEEEPDAEADVFESVEAGTQPLDAASVAAQAGTPVAGHAVIGRTLTGDGLPMGTPAPPFTLPDLDGQTHSLDSLRGEGKPLVLVFSSPTCESCQALVPRLPGLAAHAATVRVVLVSRGTPKQNRAKLGGDPGSMLVLLQTNYEVAESFDCTTSPAAIMVDADGVVRSPLAMGGVAVIDLISSRTEQVLPGA